ncbi:MAG: hypothetical protein QOJ85_1358 [Solirubrobacteraceae bacterium]|jgi:hypothetical protein|nr:hypothetical protein [Solirubrobacteraceae bacterium]MEA2242257.1 hypothetical protein [Solirubrobacteraceae bacterium]
MITIEQLNVMFEAERQRDELVFAQLFARHIARYDAQRTSDADAEERARRERSVSEGRGAW